MNTTTFLRRQRGLTLVESMVALAVTAVVAGVAVPSFEQVRERRHLEGIAAQMETDFAHARSLAVARNQTVRVHFASDSCYVVHTGSGTTCTCTAAGGASCVSGAEVLRVAQFGTLNAVKIVSNSKTMAFDAHWGTVTPTGTVRVVGKSGAEVRNVVNIMGRVRTCSPTRLAGYTNC